MNVVLKIVIGLLVTWIGTHTRSNTALLKKNGVFLSTFFNTAIILLLVNADFSGTGIPLLGFVFNGLYQDFCSQWFIHIGDDIVMTMIIGMIFPIYFSAQDYVIQCIKRIMDKGSIKLWKEDDPYNTKLTTVQQYVDLYGGGTFEIEIRYAEALKVVFVTMMFGAGLPLLYPIASATMFIYYAVEKFKLAYWYKKPPMFNNLISEDTFNWLEWAFFLNIWISFWMLSSDNLYFNLADPPKWVGGFYGKHSLICLVWPNVAMPLEFAGFAYIYYKLKPWYQKKFHGVEV
jgi:hypothetical protein